MFKFKYRPFAAIIYFFKCEKYTFIFTARSGSIFRDIRNLLVSIYFRFFNVFFRLLLSAW